MQATRGAAQLLGDAIIKFENQFVFFFLDIFKLILLFVGQNEKKRTRSSLAERSAALLTAMRAQGGETDAIVRELVKLY